MMNYQLLGNDQMRQQIFDWKQTLSELNDYSCKIEFLQCEMRNSIVCSRCMNIDKYLKTLKSILNDHEENLNKRMHIDQTRNIRFNKDKRKSQNFQPSRLQERMLE